MRPLLTPEQMAAADRATIDAGTPAGVLMERAGRAVARAAIRLVGRRYGTRAVVLCGKGNNGGDGFVAARTLLREGVAVRCLAVGDAASAEAAAKEHLDRLLRVGIRLEEFEASALDDADVIIDAIFGTGFRGSVQGAAAAAIAAVDDAGAPVVAIDIPSGVDGGTGRVEGPAVGADATVAMAAEKVGTAVGAGAAHAGRVEVVDIGIPVESRDLWVVERNDVAGVVPRRQLDVHKRSAGAVALLGGSAGMSGAVVLAARGAMRAGAGYVTAGITKDVDVAISEALPEVVTRVVTQEASLGPSVLDDFGDVLERAEALALGPGLGRGDEQTALVARALDEIELPAVVDADALNVLAQDTAPLEKRNHPTVLTPHPVELARLTSSEVGAVQADRIDAARAAAARFGAVVLLKGFRSVVASSGGAVVVIPTGGPSLATAGTGDVLTGVVAALLAAGADAFEAAWAAAYVHGLAGDLAARQGARGVVAWDVAEQLPAAFAAVLDRSTSPGR